MQFKKSVGMRTIKTGIAVVLTLYVAKTALISNPFYAAIGTVFAMQNTVKSSFVAGKNRVLGTVIGAIVGFVFASLNLQSPLFIGLAIILTIYCCNSLKLNPSIMIASTITVSILVGITNQDPLTYSFFRTVDTSVGIIIGILVNYYIAQPNYLADLLKEILIIETMTNTFVKNLLIHQCQDIHVLKSEITRLDSLFKNYHADTQFDKNPIQHHHLRLPIEACHAIYFHAKCIELLDVSETKLSDDNKLEIMKHFQEDKMNLSLLHLHQPINPIFHYHVEKLLEELLVLHNGVLALKDHATKHKKPKSYLKFWR